MTLACAALGLFLLGSGVPFVQARGGELGVVAAWPVHGGGGGAVSSSGLLRAAAEALPSHTGLELRSLEQLGLDPAELEACPVETRLGCWRTRLQRRNDVHYLWVLSWRGFGGRLRLTTLLVPIRTALTTVGRAQENELFDLSPRLSRVLTGTAAVPSALVDIVASPALQSRLTDDGHWKSHGEVSLARVPRGFEVRVDGRSVAVGDGRPMRLSALRVGSHHLQVGDSLRWSVEVRGGREVHTELPAPEARTHVGRQVLEPAALVLAGVGAVLLAVGVERQLGSRAYCLGTSCSGAGLVAIGDNFDGLRTGPSEGPSWITVGAGLTAAGVAGYAGSRGLGARDAPPWWGMALGVGAGALAAGLAAGMGGR